MDEETCRQRVRWCALTMSLYIEPVLSKEEVLRRDDLG